MRSARTLLLLGLSLCAAAPVASPSRSAWAAEPGDAEQDPVRRAEQLLEEARPWFREAGDTAADFSERRAARKEAYDRLIEARKLLDGWIDAHPEASDALDSLYCEISTMLFWIKKEMGVGELSGRAPSRGPSAGSRPAPRRATGPGQEPEQPEEPAEPEVPEGPTPADVLGEIEAHERRFPGDVPGLHERYTEFLGQFPDPSLPEYAKAALRLEDLSARLKDVYRRIRDDDPESLSSVDEAECQALVEQLVEDLETGSEPVRVRAARFLGALGSSDAAEPLVAALESDPGGAVGKAAAEALGRIGGRKVCARLARAGRDRRLEPVVIDVLAGMVKAGGPAGRIAGETLADFCADLPELEQQRVIATLADAGPAAALGLAKLVAWAPEERKAEYIEKLGAWGEPRTAEHVARFLFVGEGGPKRDQARAAREAIEKLGKAGVRYLIPALDDPAVKLWTAELLRRITGADPKDDKRRTWEKWFRQNRRSLE